MSARQLGIYERCMIAMGRVPRYVLTSGIASDTIVPLSSLSYAGNSHPPSPRTRPRLIHQSGAFGGPS